MLHESSSASSAPSSAAILSRDEVPRVCIAERADEKAGVPFSLLSSYRCARREERGDSRHESRSCVT
jgi:hypothetical protein